MFSAAKSDDERISSTNALWMLLFDTGNQKIFMEIDDAFEKITAHAVCNLIKICKNSSLKFFKICLEFKGIFVLFGKE